MDSAFPTGDHHTATFRSDGMTLRDYFAAKALQGAIAEGGTDIHADVLARIVYAIADAMLAERAK